MRRAINLRESLHAIFMAVINKQKAPQLAMDRLECGPAPRCAAISAARTRRGKLEWRFDDMTSAYDAMLWPIARAAADLLASIYVAQVRAPARRRPANGSFDTSKNHHRRWCSMKLCGNRAKVRSSMPGRGLLRDI